MANSPLYKVGDFVYFALKDGIRLGLIVVVDADLHYDIFVFEDNMLYKHCPEHFIVSRGLHKNDPGE